MIYFQLRHIFSQGIACRMFLSKTFQWTKADVKRSVELVNLFQISRRTNSRNIGNLVTMSMCLWVFQYSDTTVPFSFNNFLLEGQESPNWAGIIKVLSDRKIYRDQPTVYSCRFLPLIVSKNAPNLWLCNQTLILDILFFTWYLIFWKLSVALPFFVLPVLLPTQVTTFFVLSINLPFLFFVIVCLDMLLSVLKFLLRFSYVLQRSLLCYILNCKFSFDPIFWYPFNDFCHVFTLIYLSCNICNDKVKAVFHIFL